MSKLKAKINKLNGQVRAESFNEEKNTIDVVWSTGAKGLRYSWSNGAYYEELSMKKSAIRLDRLNKGAPVLDSHASYSLSNNLGVVLKASVKAGEGLATIQLSKREEISGIIQDIKDGVIRNISVGYKVYSYTDVSKKNDEVPTYRADDWEPMEVSFVNIPFDMDSQSRSEGQEQKEEDYYEININENQEPELGKRTEEVTPEVVPAKTEEKVVVENRQADDNKVVEENKSEIPTEENRTQEEIKSQEDKVSKEAIAAEKSRGLEIRSTCKTLGLEESFGADLIDRDIAIDESRKLMIAEKAKLDDATPTRAASVEVNDADQMKERVAAATTALQHKLDPKVELTEQARGYRGMSLLRMGEEILNAQNVSTRGMIPSEIAERSLHHTSDFVNILANVASKTLRDAYGEQAQTFDPFTRRVTVSDFKEISRTQLGDAPELEKVNESGEFKTGQLGDAAEKYKIQTFGKIVGISRQTIINDDMDALSRLPGMYGRRARDLESKLIYDLMISNPIMADGNALFSVAHGNLSGTPAVVSVASVSEARAAMRLQKGLNDLLINIKPEMILNPAAIETAVEQFLGPIAPTVNGEVNPFTGKLKQITEGKLDASSATAWYLLAMKNQIDMFELATLEGQNGPTLSSKIGFNTDGVQFKIAYDIGAAVIDWRGIYKNAGA